MNKDRNNFHPDEAVHAALKYFEDQLCVLDNFIQESIKYSDRGRPQITFPLLIGIQTAGKGIVCLTQNKLASEIFVLSRSYLERIINYCYLMSCEESHVQDFIDYGIQKGYRTTTAKKTSFNKLGHDYKNREPTKWLAQKLAKFTRKPGSEITKWSSVEFNERVLSLNEYLSDFDMSFYLNLYKDGSEASHGTFYGMLLHTGTLSETRSPAMGLQYLSAYISLTLCKLADLISVLIKTTAKNLDVDLSTFLAAAESNASAIDAFFERMKQGDPGDKMI